MKKFFKNLPIVYQTVIVEAMVGIFFMLISIVGVVFGQYGWLIGIACGTIASVISTFLMNKASEWALTGNAPFLFILCFFARMILLTGFLVLAALLQYVFKVEAFNYSIWGVIIGYTPMVLVTIIMQVVGNKNGDKK